MALTDRAIKNLKPGEKARKVADEKGLHLLVTPAGGKLWRFRYYHHGKEKLLSIGSYPEISLADARKKRDEARSLVANGLDPSGEKKAEKRRARIAAENTFESVACEFMETRGHHWSAGYAVTVRRRFENDLFPYLGKRPIAEIDPPELLDVLKRIERRGAHDMAGRVKSLAGEVFRYGIATSRCRRDVSVDLKGALKRHEKKSVPSISLEDAPALLQAIDGCEASPSNCNPLTRIGLQLLSLTMLRPQELRFGTWSEIDWDNRLWRVPPSHLKKRKGRRDPHLVPLSSQAIEKLRELHNLTGPDGIYRRLKRDGYMFPGFGPKEPMMSGNTLLYALYSLGFHGKHSAHGFRALGTTILRERKFDREWIDRQLDHDEDNKIWSAYNNAEHLSGRREMLQWLGDYLDRLRDGFIWPLDFSPEGPGAEVIQLRR